MAENIGAILAICVAILVFHIVIAALLFVSGTVGGGRRRRAEDELVAAIQAAMREGGSELVAAILGAIRSDGRALQSSLRDDARSLQAGLRDDGNALQASLRDDIGAMRDAIVRQLEASATEQFSRFGMISSNVSRAISDSSEAVSRTLEAGMRSLQASNEKRLESMQAVVDEKLQKSLEARLNQSFELVSKQLEGVSLGLGEMRSLAADARSLKHALTNVKDRGTYGETRLEKLLMDTLAPGQYATNVEIAPNRRVEFAVKLPGSGGEPMLLPIDSKFPVEDYNRLLDADDRQAQDEARRALAARVRAFAKDIRDKYVAPPMTTDFALMFLPTEGLYAEVIRNASLFEELRDRYKVTVVGAATLSAFLGSLQMGFKTLAIERRSMEVWDALRAVKGEFAKFGDMLDRAHRQIRAADATLDEIVGRRTRAINRTLREVGAVGDAAAVGASADSGSIAAADAGDVDDAADALDAVGGAADAVAGV